MTIVQQKCLRCENLWYPKTTIMPKVCPNCNSRKWNVPRDAGNLNRKEKKILKVGKALENKK